MEAATAATLLLQLIIVTATTASSQSFAHPQHLHGGSCVAAERAALLSFKQGITVDPLDLLGSWQGRGCCRWNGVRCRNGTGHVIRLDLRNMFYWQDQADLYLDNPRGMQGQVSTSLLALGHLKHLDLSGNNLGGGGAMPSFLGSLRNLVYLNISCINFNGRVPPQLGNLSRLLYLDISNTYTRSTQVYSTDISWLGRISSLRHLDMSGVNLTSVTDWAHVVNMLPNLRALHLQSCQLTRSTPPLVHSNLTLLEDLDLSDNIFYGPLAPNWFWDIKSLRTLKLEYSQLYGPIPDELGNMTALRVLDLQDNENVTGMFPRTLKNLCNLEELVFTSVNLGGDITEQMERLPRCSWEKLRSLGLTATNMTGNLPVWLGSLTSLQMLGVSDNQISGHVPLGLGALSNLSVLYLGNSNLSGVITQDHLANLVSLKIMDLSFSSLEIVLDSAWTPPFRLLIVKLTACQVGPRFPVLLKQQKGISQIQMSNTGIEDTIPDWFWDAISYASIVDMSNNQIYGELPTKIEAMTWQELHFNSNQLNGSVPELLRNVTKLDISRNLLSGPLPSNFQGPELAAIVLFNNYISGVVPKSICSGFVDLAILDLSNNHLSGKLPECNDTGDFATLGIRTILLANNSLSGEFPALLKICRDITFVDLAKNNMHGNLPAWIGDLSSLVIFRLRSNMFSGHIPSEITRLQELQYLDLALNNISGMIPHSLANLTAMTSMNLDPGRKGLDGPFVQSSENFGEVMEFEWYGDSLYVAMKGRELPYSTQLLYLVSIDLSSNNLVGKIPEEVGSLVGLINLNLSSNHLTGNIPYQIGTLQLLESLDISHNQVSGEIPQTLSNLTSLSYLNMSYNNLSGTIPSGHQLDTLDTDDPASMYIGNTGLCGHPLPNNCSEGEEPHSNPIGQEDSNNSAPNGLHLGAIVGLVVGLWLVFCAFLFKRRWRIAYFRFIDTMYDKAYVFVIVNWAVWFRKSHTPSST
ncbi:unnamed protein product [Alopecurus aequalis]